MGEGTGSEIIRFFESKGCLAEPRLVEYLAAAREPLAHAAEGLSGLEELPLFLSLGAFRQAHEKGSQRRAGRSAPDVVLLSDLAEALERDEGRRKALSSMMLELETTVARASEPGRGPAASAVAARTVAPEPLPVPPAFVPGPSRRLPASTPAPPSLVPPEPSVPLPPHGPHAPETLPTAVSFEAPWTPGAGAAALLGGRPVEVRLRSGWTPLAAEYAPEVRILKDVTGNSTCQGTVEDFHRYFTSRYDALSRLLRKRREVANAIPVERASGRRGHEVQLIGMVNEVATTPNGHRILEIEDRTGSIKVLAAKRDAEVLVAAGMIVPDEVVGIVGKVSDRGDIVYAKQIVRPDTPLSAERRRSEVPLWAAFLSDIHAGSRKFLEDRFRKMVDWLAGGSDKAKERDVAGRIKYLVLPGDMVDGIGVYPGQEAELAIPDVYEQYAHLAHLLADLPDHIQILAQPGNHDAARPVEPQPALDHDVRERFGDLPMTFVSNPCTFSLHGVRVLSYHGCSLMDFATSVRGLDHFKPLPIMQEILKTRHIAPIYGGGTPLAPEHQDYMVIDEPPEIFATGHVHTTGVDRYRGVTMVSCSCWQSQTDYQRMLNFHPDPCRMPIVDLQRLHATFVDFNQGLT